MLSLDQPTWYRWQKFTHSRWFHLLLLFLWLVIGAILRFIRLGVLPPWTDECATIAFSLGNSFRHIPVNELIGWDILLSPLQLTPNTNIDTVVDRLFQESTHPPAYFILTHWWLKLFPSTDGLASIWGARSLSALLGVASIPAMFGLGCLACKQRLVGHLAAAAIAISPYAIFLARDARHYTLAILLVIASLSCLITAIQSIHRRQPLPIYIALAWVAINSLGMATHYFFTLTICAQGIVLFAQAWRQIYLDQKVAGRELLREFPRHPAPQFSRQQAEINKIIFDLLLSHLSVIANYKYMLGQRHWQRIYAVAAGTMIGCLIWLPALQTINGSEPTNWIYDGNPHVEWLTPIARLLMWILSMVWLFPSAITILPIAVIIISGLVTLSVFILIFPTLKRGFQLQQQNPDSGLAIQILGEYSLGAIALVVLLTYALGMDLTLGARFQFIYFPALILLFSITLAGVWYLGNPEQKQLEDATVIISTAHTRKPILPPVIAIAFLIGFVGSLTVIWNLSYLQNHRPDLLAPIIQKASQSPIIIATTHKHHGQTGRMMGLAWEFRQQATKLNLPLIENSKQQSQLNLPELNNNPYNWIANVQFFLANRDSETRSYQNAIQLLEQKLSQIPRPLDLWLIDFRANFDLESQQCFRDSRYGSLAGEYKYKLYRCLVKK